MRKGTSRTSWSGASRMGLFVTREGRSRGDGRSANKAQASTGLTMMLARRRAVCIWRGAGVTLIRCDVVYGVNANTSASIALLWRCQHYQAPSTPCACIRCGGHSQWQTGVVMTVVCYDCNKRDASVFQASCLPSGGRTQKTHAAKASCSLKGC